VPYVLRDATAKKERVSTYDMFAGDCCVEGIM